MSYYDPDIPSMTASKVHAHSQEIWNHIAAALGPKEPMTAQPTLMDIANALEAKGLLSEKSFICDLCSMLHIHDEEGNIVNLPDEITHAILRDAMTSDLDEVERVNAGEKRWVAYRRVGERQRQWEYFKDQSHNNCPTQSLYAAWCWAKEIK